MTWFYLIMSFVCKERLDITLFNPWGPFQSMQTFGPTWLRARVTICIVHGTISCRWPCHCKLRGSLSLLPQLPPCLCLASASLHVSTFFFLGAHIGSCQETGNPCSSSPYWLLPCCMAWTSKLSCLCFQPPMVIIIKYGPTPKPIEGLASALVVLAMGALVLRNMATSKTWHLQPQLLVTIMKPFLNFRLALQSTRTRLGICSLHA